MMMAIATHEPTRVNLIAGPLGAGKTTAINHLLEHRPDGEKWAVLVNEFGLVGLDAALMGASEGNSVEIREVAGGCICCTAAVMFEVALVKLLRRRPDRLLIEPTGLAAATGILNTLAKPGIRGAVDLRSVICLLDPRRFQEDLRRDEVADQVAAADILLASRPDLATLDQLAAFDAWARTLVPAKDVVGRVMMGRVDRSLLEPITERSEDRSEAAARRDSGHLHDHDHASEPATHADLRCDASRPMVRQAHRSLVATTVGWTIWGGLVFDAERLAALLQELGQWPGARRVKAVFRTDHGWQGFNIADGDVERTSQRARRDSRLELVIEGEQPPEAGALEERLRACVAPRPAQVSSERTC